MEIGNPEGLPLIALPGSSDFSGIIFDGDLHRIKYRPTFAPLFEEALGHGVMVTQQILVLLFRVRVLVTQQTHKTPVNLRIYGGFFFFGACPSCYPFPFCCQSPTLH